MSLGNISKLEHLGNSFPCLNEPAKKLAFAHEFCGLDMVLRVWLKGHIPQS